MPSWLGVLNYTEGRRRRLLAYRGCSSPNQVPLQRSVINKQKARGTSWAVIKESSVLSYTSDKKADPMPIGGMPNQCSHQRAAVACNILSYSACAAFT
ncbi:hypothetical protein PoB_006703500 [Plakobranchus ocellatus]|uniref:Uncharacterized protein n=1 Tax=Plakobranchus ocellatus TaxID=259542 RepID=A0AAV4D989_9GAST|nr:hypothetical protein PoB_006703500 [Plakobranchus ocellatus]